MSHDFKLKFDEMRESKPTGENNASGDNAYETFDTPGHVRNLCFVWPDGRKKFLNYAYLVSGEYSPDDGAIMLKFTSELVQLSGFGLDRLFEDIFSHNIKRIICVDQRYSQTATRNTIITEILIFKTDKE